MFEVIHYLNESGIDVFQEYLNSMKDIKARIAILRRIDRAAKGNFGDHRENIRGGVCELKIDIGPGYRVYYAVFNNTMVLLLLNAGTKKDQQGDIDRAEKFLKDYMER